MVSGGWGKQSFPLSHRMNWVRRRTRNLVPISLSDSHVAQTGFLAGGLHDEAATSVSLLRSFLTKAPRRVLTSFNTTLEPTTHQLTFKIQPTNVRGGPTLSVGPC